MNFTQVSPDTLGYMTFVDHPLVTIEMAREYVNVLDECHQPFEEEFLEAKLPFVLEGNKDSLIPIRNTTELENRLLEIISICDEFNALYREPFVKALYKQAMVKLSDRLQYVREGYTIQANYEYQMAMQYLSVVSQEYLTRALNMEPQAFFNLANREEVIERIRVLIAGVIWTQTNVGRHHHEIATNEAAKSATASLQQRLGDCVRFSNLCSEITLPEAIKSSS